MTSRSYLSGWRLALRLARRDLAKHPARAIIALVMVTLPVIGVITADILIQTADVSSAEGIDRRIGVVATAGLEATPARVEQSPDPSDSWGSTEELPRAATIADVERIIGDRDVAAAPTRTEALVVTRHGREPVSAEQLDPAARLTRGLFRLDTGRWPRSTDEVVVNKALADRGVGDTLTVVGRDRSETTRRIVGTVRDASRRTTPAVVGLPGSLPSGPDNVVVSQSWLVDGPPITWEQLRALNDVGVLVTDRYMVTHPGEFPDPMSYGSGLDDTTVQVAALIVVMALIEVVLLAGPAIAVGARKQQRSLALLVASGGTPAQARRVILAGGVLLGVASAVVGVVGGIGAAWLLRPLVQRFSPEWLGPFEVPWWHLLAVAVFGMVSAFLACLVPAWIASRQNVVAVLAGRRGDAKPMRAFPVLGVVLVVVGVLMAVAGARGRGDLMVAWSAVVCVLGMVLLVPVVVSAVAGFAGRLPLPVRFAARDAVRHRTRTTPAVAAVAATVAGVVALGISTASDAKQDRETYTPILRMGDAAVMASSDYYSDGPAPSRTDWTRISALVRKAAPQATLTPVRGLGEPGRDGGVELTFMRPGASADDDWIGPGWYGSALGTDLLVSDGSDLPPTVADAAKQADPAQALATGTLVLFSSDRDALGLDRVEMRLQATTEDGEVKDQRTAVVPVRIVYVDPAVPAPARALIPPAVAGSIGLHPATVALSMSDAHLSKAAQKDLAAALEALPAPAGIYVERGYEAPSEEAILQWVLAALGAVLMLGGTLTASFLALADARPDLATLAAVGAAPRTRRGVAAAYTFVVGFVGAVLGMLVGFVPGIAITWPLTAEGSPGSSGPYLAIPWLMIAAVVVGLPILTAGVVALCTRSRLPMVARLS